MTAGVETRWLQELMIRNNLKPVQENVEQQTRDSDMIFTQVSTAGYASFEEAQRLVVTLYVPDMSISRSGISHALKRLEKHFKEEGQNDQRL